MQILEMMAMCESIIVKDRKQYTTMESVKPITKNNPAYKEIANVVKQIKNDTTKDAVMLYPKANSTPKLLDSKIGGIPYCPTTGDNPPADMELIVQINFSDRSIPHLSDFPKSGILQIFSNDKWPMGNDIRYYPSILEPDQTESDVITKFPYLAETNYANIVMRPVTLIGRKVKENLPISHKAYIEYLRKYLGDPGDDKKLYDLRHMILSTPEFANSTSNGFGHKLGGYHAFTQNDILEYNKSQIYELLVQIDSDSKHVMWGDNGIANWFINRDKLKKLNFSDILGNWDCY